MRILAFTNCPLNPQLGSGRAVLRCTNGMRQLGHEVLTVEPDTVTVALKLRRGWRWRIALGSWLKGLKLVQDFKPDLVEIYGAEFGWLAQRLRAQKNGPLLVAHLNGIDALSYELIHPGKLDSGRTKARWQAHDVCCFSSVHRVAALCTADANYVVERGWQTRAHCGIVEHGLDGEFLAPSSLTERDHAVAFSGSWTERKNPTVIVAVMSALLREDASLRFDVMGAAADAAAVRAAFPAEVRGQVRVHDRLTDTQIAGVLNRAKVFFFPSLYEGYGMALSEAMACGCAAVTTATGLGSDLRPNQEALIFPARDVPALQQAVRYLLKEDSARIKLAEQGRARFAQMTWPHQIAELDTLYQRWLAEFRQTRAQA
jgi:glycosyltransferase involved in cell wall biosynthesis